MANQDAFSRAKGFSLEGQKAGYAMAQAAKDAKSNAISAGITGLGNLAMSYAQNKYNQDMIGWGIRNGAYAPQSTEGWTRVRKTDGEGRAKGGKIKKRKGLNF